MFDFIIIGAGIVGLATARELQQRYPQKTVAIIEKETRPAEHQTGHNSGVIHAGIYYPKDSLKATLCRAGNRTTKDFCRAHDIPFAECGKLVVATNSDELTRLSALYRRSAENQIQREWWEQATLQAREPNITGLAAIFVPSTGIVSYRAICEKMAALVVESGGEIIYETAVEKINEAADTVSVVTTNGTFSARNVIVCGGLHADHLARAAGIEPPFSIYPFRGEYYQLPTDKAKIVNHLIYPVPEPNVPFLGVHLTKMIDGSVTVGPNAVLAMRREGYRKTDFSPRDMFAMARSGGFFSLLRRHFRHGIKEQRNSWCRSFYLREVQKYCPSLTRADLLPYPAGVRAQAVDKQGNLIDDFLFLTTERVLHVCNAPSPAATSAIPIAGMIVDKVSNLQI